MKTVRVDAALPRAGNKLRALWARLPKASRQTGDAEILTGMPGGDYASVIGATALVLLSAGTPALPAGSCAPALLLDHEEDRDRLSVPRAESGAIVVGITGTSGSGKTTVAAGIVRRLTAAGLRVAVVKHAAHGFVVDRTGSDSARFADAGAHLIVLAGPDGTALRMATAVENGEQAARLADDAARAVLGASADVLLIEGFQHPGRPVIEVGDQKPGIAGSGAGDDPRGERSHAGRPRTRDRSGRRLRQGPPGTPVTRTPEGAPRRAATTFTALRAIPTNAHCRVEGSWRHRRNNPAQMPSNPVAPPGDAVPPRTLAIDRIDHIVLTVRDVDTTCAFYERVPQGCAP